MKPRLWIALLGLVVSGLVLALTTDASGRDGLLFGLWRTRYVAVAVALVAASVTLAASAHSRRAAFALIFGGMMTLFMVGLLDVVGLAGLVSYGELFRNTRTVPTNDLASHRRPDVLVEGETYQDILHSWGIAHDAIPFSYDTDSYGFRNPTHTCPPSVVLLGDSILVGAAVPAAEIVSGRLAAASNQRVMNVALIGLSVQQEQQIFVDAGIDPRGKRIIQFVFEGNDLLDSATWRAARSAEAEGRDDASSSYVDRSFTSNFAQFLQRVSTPVDRAGDRLRCEIAGQPYAFGWTSRSFVGAEGEIPVLLSALSDFSDQVRAAGGEYAVVFVPTKLRVLGPLCDGGSELGPGLDREIGPLRNAILEWSADSGTPVLDLTDPLVRAARAGRVPWIWGDTHWNADGHRVAAEAVMASGWIAPSASPADCDAGR